MTRIKWILCGLSCGACWFSSLAVANQSSLECQPNTSSMLMLIANPQKDIRERVNAVHYLGTHLDEREIAGLYSFLKSPPDKRESRPCLHYLKNEIFVALRNQTTAPKDLTRLMIEISRDTKQEMAIRDYALQHLALWCQEGAPDNPDAKDEIQSLFSETAHQANSLAGTALLGLDRFAGANSTPEGQNVVRLALQIANSSAMPVAAKTTAIAICGERKLREALPAMEVAAKPGQPTGLRVAAIGALGRIGTARQIGLLRTFESDHNPLIHLATTLALERLDRTIASR